ncbi:TerD family protein [Mucilaginibacter gilvus]|uniref:TerD family protein n=1 Tax=Mucilaginibacter gilvus TaxID=2305909 RepID=A0A444MPU2_9SPHI|nr:TerD family protein [Mucilaginibacter gilvus]RWY52607.1 TerD family protein [Mucilaginibacter gilvus]
MAITLRKGERINIGLSKISVGLGWNPNEGTGLAFDLDASAIMIGTGRLIPAEEFFVFYGNTTSPDGALSHSGDDPTGGNSDGGDDEVISVDLNQVDPRITEILFVVTIHEATHRRQNFGQVRDAYIRIVDETTGMEIAKYELDEDFSIETGIEFGRLYKKDVDWKFEASGVGYREDLSYFLSKHFKGEIIK